MRFDSIPVDRYAAVRAQNTSGVSLSDVPPTHFFKAVGREWYYGITGLAIQREQELVAVMNNDPKHRGALPFILADATRKGFTVLNAWNVRSAKYPDGLLATLYSRSGLVPFKTEPYDLAYGEPDVQLKAAWASQGWREGEPLPAVVYFRRPTAFTFAALFAGIGGARQAAEGAGGRCVFSVERDRFARETYTANFPVDFPDAYAKDITDLDAATMPDFDFLTAGFPCQPFSIAGVSKKNSLGKAHGFKDQAQGNLFFDIIRVLKAKQPAAFLLENVKNLKHHDGGKTFARIHDELTALGYQVSYRVVSAKGYVPQGRERMFIAGFRTPVAFTLDDVVVKDPEKGPRMRSILHRGVVDARYTLTSHMWQYLKAYAAKHKAAGHGFGFGLVGPDDVARTLSARYYKDGSEILVKHSPRPRRLTPRECARLMGFPDTFIIPVSDSQAYKQFGNSVVVPEVQALITAMTPHIQSVANSERSVAA